MDRRDFLATTAAIGVSSAIPSRLLGDQRDNAVASEVGELRKVIVHPPGAESRRSFPFMHGSHSMLNWELLREEAVEQHAALVNILKSLKVDVLYFEHLIDEAIEQTRRQGTLGTWLKEVVPKLSDHVDKVSAAMLIGRDDRFVYDNRNTDSFRTAIDPLTTMFFTRDVAVATPRGTIICNFQTKQRALETSLASFAFEHAPTLQEYPVVFDAVKEQVHIQGGDVMVLDPNTLMIGVGNSTEGRAAKIIAQKLDIDVITVQMPNAGWQPGEWEGLQFIFYHLDCLLNFVDKRKVLAVPYLLEREFVDRNPLLEVLYGFARFDPVNSSGRLAMLAEVRDVGWLKRFKAGSGESDRDIEEMKILDYLKDRGYTVVSVGGAAETEASAHQHVIERVVRECRFMAVNVFAVGPGKVVAYEGTPHTLEALRDAGIEVTTFPSYELVRANGGPRCLTMPLDRESFA